MKHVILLLLLLPLSLFSQKKKPVCEPSKITFLKCCDTTNVVVNVAPQQNCLWDTTFIKAVIGKTATKNPWWDKWGSFVIALIPILLGFLAYRYAIKQMIAKARLEWIDNFKNSSSTL